MIRNIARILKKRASHGFTLVEMIIAIALLAVLLGGMVILTAPVLNTVTDNEKLITAESVSSTIQEYVTRTLRNSSKIVVVSNASYDDNKSTAVNNEVNALRTYVNKVTTENGGVAMYSLKCLSLRYIDGSYYLCNEPVDLTKIDTILTGNENASTLKGKVFSDCLYNDLYLDCKLEKGQVKSSTLDPVTGTYPYEESDNFLQLGIDTYTDSGKNVMVCSTSSVMELRQIKFALRAGEKNTDYYVHMVDAGSATGKDIYIYYVARLLNNVT